MIDFTMPKPAAWLNLTDSYSVITQEEKDSNILQFSDAFLDGHDKPLYTAEALRDVLEKIANQLEFTGLTGNDIRAMKDAIK